MLRQSATVLSFALLVAVGCGGKGDGDPSMDMSGQLDIDKDVARTADGTNAFTDTSKGDDAYLEPDLPPDTIPSSLSMVWTNLENNDMVTVRKKIVLEFDFDTRLPENEFEESWYNKIFAPRVTLWDAANDEELGEVEIVATWRKIKPGMHRRPALIIEPAPCDKEDQVGCPFGALVPQYNPTTVFRLTVWLGNKSHERVFHTIPGWTAGYKIVDFVVEPEECPRCFPYPVRVHVFIPPEYNSPDPEYNNTSIPWDNSAQRYPSLVGLHTYGGQGLTLADTFGWATLPRFTAQGVLEPMLLVLPDGTVPEPYCKGGFKWPVTGGKTCYTQHMGIPNPEQIPDFNAYTCFSYFMTHTMRREVAKRFRIRGMDDDGNKLGNDGNIIDEENEKDETGANRDFYRRSWGVTGCSGGGFGTPINTFLFPDDYGAMLALIGASPSMLNPYAYHGHSGITHDQLCNKDGNGNYPWEPMQDGFRDLSMIDPATMTPCPEGQLCKQPQSYCLPAEECTAGCDEQPCRSTGTTRDVTADQREIPAGAKSCFWMSPPPVSNAIALAVICGLDATCRVDKDAPESWRVDFEKYPFDGNLMFTTGILDFEGPPAGFMDLDQQLDKRGVPHSFRFEDRGSIYHDWNSVHDYVEGWPEITRKDGTVSPGNFPGTGILYPFMNNAFEALGNYAFNHPFASEFTTGALDPDRDYVVDCIYEPNPDLNFVEDNCPGVPNPDQRDSDGDGIGDACDE